MRKKKLETGVDAVTMHNGFVYDGEEFATSVEEDGIYCPVYVKDQLILFRIISKEDFKKAYEKYIEPKKTITKKEIKKK